MPEALRPECVFLDCEEKSKGGNFDSFSGGTMGGGIYVVRFECGGHGTTTFCVSSDRLYPGWKLGRRHSKGIYTAQRLTQRQQLDRVREPLG